MIRRIVLMLACVAGVAVHLFAQPCPGASQAPVAQSPSNQNFGENQGIPYSWTPSTASGVTSYEVHVLVGATSTLACSTGSSGTSCNGPGLPAGNYSWAVKALFSTCPPLSSNGLAFTVGCATSAPGLQSPSNNAQNVATTTSFTWNAVSTADTYDVYLGTGAAACTGQPVFTTTGTTFTPPAGTLQGATTYGWRVAAKHTNVTGCPIQTSSCFSFTTSGATCNQAGSFNLLTPKSGDGFTSAPSLNWSASSGATQYFVHLGAANPPPQLTAGQVNAPNTSYAPAALSPGTYYWSITAVPSCGAGFKRDSNVSSFTIMPLTCPIGPVLESPVDGATQVISPVKFDWKPSAGATTYKLQAILTGNAAPTVLALTRDTEATASVPDGATEWWVEAMADNCPSAPSTHFHFTAGSGACPTNPGSPTNVSPANGTTGLNSPVTFQWNGVAGATGYRVWASSASASGTSSPFFVGATSGATQVTAPVPQGTLFWYVEARFGDCPSTYSKPFTMTVATGAACNNTAATLREPANSATGVSSPVEFKWNSPNGAIGFKLFVNGELVGVTTDNSLIRLVPDGLVTWRVDTMYAGCNDVRSGDFHFTAGTQSSCGGSISLVAPANGATIASPAVLSWSAVAGAKAYRVWVAGGSANATPSVVTRTNATSATVPLPSGPIRWYVEALFDTCPSILSADGTFTVSQAPNCDTHKAVTLAGPTGLQNGHQIDFSWTATDSSAISYRVWISVDGDPFADIGATTDTHFSHEVDAGAVRWFVESFFAGCPPVLSAIGTFTVPGAARCNNAAPLLVAPSEGASTVTSPVTFIWNAVDDADHYRIFVALNGGEDVKIAHTEDTSVTKALPPGAYVWFVEAVFDECPVTRSAKGRFTVPRGNSCSTEASQLLAPANGAANVASHTRLEWSPVSGATGYAVMARHVDGASTPLGETAGTELTRDFPEGSIEWWVVAFFNSCPAVASTHATFTVPATACDNRRPVPLSPAEGASGIVSPVRFVWSAVRNAKSYKVWASVDGDGVGLIGTATDNKLTISVPAGVIKWYVEAMFDTCPAVQSAESLFVVRRSPPPCGTPDRPHLQAPGQVASGSTYTVRWTAVANASGFELQESAAADFSNAATQTVNDLFAVFAHTAANTAQKWFYRVRAVSNCSDERGPYSRLAGVFVLPDKPLKSTSVEVGTGTAKQTVFIAGQNPAVNFTATTDKPFATVSPASGIVGPAGVTLTVTYDAAALKLGTNTVSVTVTYSAAGKTGAAAVAPATKVPISITTVTPVTTGGKSGPPPDALIVPVIGHAQGVNDSLFVSDVRIANTSAQTMKYQLNFTLSGSDGTQTGQSTTIQVDPGATMALDDILTSLFGVGSDGANSTGVLEVRTLTTTSQSITSTSSANVQTTAVSSRTYNSTANGTFGQFIPAIPFSQFIGKTADGAANTRITLQQIAQSDAYRTNLGLVEGAGEPADVRIHVFDVAGTEVKSIDQSLQPGEHRQLNQVLATNNVSLTDGRFEIEVLSATGKITAYASTVDNATNDPLCVLPVQKNSITSTRYVVPGVADINNAFSNWRSDIRIFNSSTADVPATLTYYAQGSSTGVPAQTTIKSGEVKVIDNALQSLYNMTNSGGSIVVTTPSSTPLVVTARTFNQTSNGTYGQFIPAVTPAQSTGAGEKTLQLLQLEQSDRFRTNIGLAETSGNPATVEVAVIVPDSKVQQKTTFSVGANEFLQFTLGTNGFGLTNAYNARVTVRVLSGSGRVTAYGSVIDAVTQDPTYVPAQ